MRRITAACTIPIAVGLWLFVTFAEAQTPSARASAATKYSTKIAVGGPAVELSWPVLVADQLGYFADEGVKVTLLITGPGATLQHAFTTRQVDFLGVGFIFPVNMRTAGVPVKTVLEYNARDFFQLAVRQGLKDQVRTVADLKGRRVGFLGPGGLAWMAGLVALRAAGLDPDRGDVEYINVGGSPAEVYTAMQQGKIDAFPLWEPVLTRARRDGIAYSILSSADPQQHRQWWGSDRIQNLGLLVLEETIKSKPDLVKGVVQAHKRALKFVRTQPPEKVAEIVLSHPQGKEWWGYLDRDVLVGATQTAMAVLGDGCISPSSFNRLMGLLIQYKISKQRITFDEYAHTTWAGTCPE